MLDLAQVLQLVLNAYDRIANVDARKVRMTGVVLEPFDEEDSQRRDRRQFVELSLLDVATDLEVD